MLKSYSIANAKSHLGELVHLAEAGPPVELTRRGRPVAMVVSMRDYQRLKSPRPSVAEVIRGIRERDDFEPIDDPDEVFPRDRSLGKDFSW